MNRLKVRFSSWPSRNSSYWYRLVPTRSFFKAESYVAKLIIRFIFILLSRESNRGALHRTSSDSLRSWSLYRTEPAPEQSTEGDAKHLSGGQSL